MIENDFFVIDLVSCKNTGEIIKNISFAFEMSGARGRNIILKLQNVILNQSQMLSIQSLISSYNSVLAKVQTASDVVEGVCHDLGIEVEKMSFDIEIKKPEIKEDMTIKPVEIPEIVEKEDKKEEENTEKTGTIGVYKKAYDENELNNEVYEEIDFYAPPTDDPIVADTKKTMYVTQTLRSGQVLEYDGNIIIIGDCHPGSEVKATGDITVWGVLGSIAHAGMKGNKDAKIRALKMNAVQLRIANCYSRRPDGTNIPYIIKSSVFMPEEARIVDDNIILFKIN